MMCPTIEEVLDRVRFRILPRRIPDAAQRCFSGKWQNRLTYQESGGNAIFPQFLPLGVVDTCVDGQSQNTK